MRHLRRMVYRWGYRPKPGTILYSPSLALIYAWQDEQGSSTCGF